jgi:hypothetical protein
MDAGFCRLILIFFSSGVAKKGVDAKIGHTPKGLTHPVRMRKWFRPLKDQIHGEARKTGLGRFRTDLVGWFRVSIR